MVGAGGDEDGEGNDREGGREGDGNAKKVSGNHHRGCDVGRGGSRRGIRPTIKHNACGNVKIRHMADEQNGVRLVGGVMKGLEG